MRFLAFHNNLLASYAARLTQGFCTLQKLCGAALLTVIATLSPTIAKSQILLPVPSGQPVEFVEVLLDNNPGELWVRFRFIAPKIGSTTGRIGYDVASADMEHLCQTLAIPYVAQHELNPARVVISLSDRPVEFGHSEPDATQFFEAYRLEQSNCIWEGL